MQVGPIASILRVESERIRDVQSIMGVLHSVPEDLFPQSHILAMGSVHCWLMF